MLHLHNPTVISGSAFREGSRNDKKPADLIDGLFRKLDLVT